MAQILMAGMAIAAISDGDEVIELWKRFKWQ